MAAGKSRTIFVVRNDENSDYDRVQAADYLARLKDALLKDGSNPGRPVVMTREITKPDRTNIEIIESPQTDVAAYQSQGFNQA